MEDVENERANPNLVWDAFDEEAMILDVSSGDYFSLNPVATEVWNALHQGHSEDEIVQTLAKKYETDPETVKAGVDELIAQLRESKLWT